jgi:hypothetical protein
MNNITRFEPVFHDNTVPELTLPKKPGSAVRESPIS